MRRQAAHAPSFCRRRCTWIASLTLLLGCATAHEPVDAHAWDDAGFDADPTALGPCLPTGEYRVRERYVTLGGTLGSDCVVGTELLLERVVQIPPTEGVTGGLAPVPTQVGECRWMVAEFVRGDSSWTTLNGFVDGHEGAVLGQLIVHVLLGDFPDEGDPRRPYCDHELTWERQP
jgi:hypothetical protein